jgi:GDP-4-dehydro-6-deoxy-D-mannose reductase
MPIPNRILVTGASGFVGRNLLPAIKAAVPDCVLVAAAETGNADGDTTVPLDLCDPSSVSGCIQAARPDAVIHLAARSSVSGSFSDPQETWRVNVDGTLLLAQALQQTAPEALFIFVSSAEAYGLSFQRGVPLDEGAALAPANPYAASKAAADIALGEMGLRGLKVVRLRPVNHTGPGQADAFVVPSFARQIARIEAGLQEPVVYTGALERWRDFLDVRDVTAAYVAALRHGLGLTPGTVVNIASGTARRIGDILDGLIARSGVAIAVRTDETRLRPTDVVSAVCDPSRARTLLDWQPVVAWDETLDSVLEDWRRRVRQGG